MPDGPARFRFSDCTQRPRKVHNYFLIGTWCSDRRRVNSYTWNRFRGCGATRIPHAETGDSVASVMTQVNIITREVRLQLEVGDSGYEFTFDSDEAEQIGELLIKSAKRANGEDE